MMSLRGLYGKVLMLTSAVFLIIVLTQVFKLYRKDRSWTKEMIKLETRVQDGRYTTRGSDNHTKHDNIKLSNSKERDPEEILSRFKDRSRHLQEQCAVPEYFNPTLQDRVGGNLMSLAYNRLRYCPILKVGSSFQLFLTRDHFQGKDKDESMSKVRKTYVVVREPYSRLFSGFVDRIVTWQPWWREFGSKILAVARPNATAQVKQCGSDVTFPEFVKYLIYSQKTAMFKNGHFIPIHKFCDICRKHYDFVVHLETMKEDFAYMLNDVSIKDTDLNFDDSESTLKGKCNTAVKQKPGVIKCKDMCRHMQILWWSFQVRGLISEDIPLPFTETDCNSISGEQFAGAALRAHRESASTINRSKQKRGALVKEFLKIPLEDRLRLKDVYLPDFELFGYDPTPPDLFPEMKKIN